LSFRVLLLADVPGWIVERVCLRMQAGIPEIAQLDYYTRFDVDRLRRTARDFDLVHYANWDCGHLLDAFRDLEPPLILSIRSHRYPPYVREAARLARVVHTITPALQAEFPGSVYIPNGVFDPAPDGRAFVVGFAGRPDEYKGFSLIAEACERAGAVFRPATGDVPPDEMADYYRGLDVYVCASVAEGHSTPVMECLALNKPVITTRVGLPMTLSPLPSLSLVDRDVDAIADAIRARMTRAQVLPKYGWETTCAELRRLYAAVVASSGRLPADYVGRYDGDLVAFARHDSNGRNGDGAGGADLLRLELEEERKRNQVILSLSRDLLRSERALDAATRRALAAETALQAHDAELAELRGRLQSRSVRAALRLRGWAGRVGLLR
jgi:hypothetical protein